MPTIRHSQLAAIHPRLPRLALRLLLLGALTSGHGLALAADPPAATATAPQPTLSEDKQPAPEPVVYDLQIVATVHADQSWEKDDPEYPGRQWSKGSSSQRYELSTQLLSDGVLDPRNLLDHDLETRLEAKVIHLARRAVKLMEAAGKHVKIPTTPAEEAALYKEMQSELRACNSEPRCYGEIQTRYAAIIAAMNYPEALEEDTVPGRYQYFLPFRNCHEKSRVKLDMAIEGVRYNKTVDEFVPFAETHTADTVDSHEGLSLCDRFLAVIDTEEKERSFYLENVFVPRPIGVTTYTELEHTSTRNEPQPIIPAVLDWMTATLRQAPPTGKATASLPLYLALNGNQTWLGLWKGEAKVEMEWRFEASQSAAPLAGSGAAAGSVAP